MTDSPAADTELRTRLGTQVDGLRAPVAPSDALEWARELALREVAPGVAAGLKAEVLDAAHQADIDDRAKASASLPPLSPTKDVPGRIGLTLGFASPIALLAGTLGAVELGTASWIATGLLLAAVAVIGATGGRGNVRATSAPGTISAGALRLLACVSFATAIASAIVAFTSGETGQVLLFGAGIQAFVAVLLFMFSKASRLKRTAPQVADMRNFGPRTDEEEQERLSAISAPLERKTLHALPSHQQLTLRAAELELIAIFEERGVIGAELASAASSEILTFWDSEPNV